MLTVTTNGTAVEAVPATDVACYTASQLGYGGAPQAQQPQPQPQPHGVGLSRRAD
ncbi:hypothetical protein [Mycobacterium sp.]|uniref:hypothetical protein n=1 Tax=Mycobacterium sp. TaxID=1785 RepID=UPI002D3C42F6|nr:hypothetical protein [Mycobacterium sp.]HZA11954.1 hypothetical protein [Mycobacterium sp.]